jgi:squalene synthase HpnC
VSLNGVDHYENFPVGSVLVPPGIRPAVLAIYRFARHADDLADEGDAPADERLRQLAALNAALDALFSGVGSQVPVVDQLAPCVAAHALPQRPFTDLLSAFSQDVSVTRYPSYDVLLDYCKRSANPVGTLMLKLMGVEGAAAQAESDAICSALQLINFMQDIAIDWQKGRIYMPLDDLGRYGIGSAEIHQYAETGQFDTKWPQFLAYFLGKTRALMLTGAALPRRLPGRMRWELALTMAGGLRILERIEAVHYNVFRHRPTLSWRDGPALTRLTLKLI